MTVITLKVSEEEKLFLQSMAKFEGKSLSELIRERTLASLEDEYDAKIADMKLEEYEKYLYLRIFLFIYFLPLILQDSLKNWINLPRKKSNPILKIYWIILEAEEKLIILALEIGHRREIYKV